MTLEGLAERPWAVVVLAAAAEVAVEKELEEEEGEGHPDRQKLTDQ